jgi:hypothetical protein
VWEHPLTNPPPLPTPASPQISFRGVMTKIMCTPYERREGYTLRVSRYHNTIYLCQEAPSQAPPRKLLPTHHRMTYGGYRFEGYCTLPALPETLSPEEIRRTKEDATVDTHIEYCSVFRTRLGQHRLIMGAEVDCCVGPKPPRDEAIAKYVELKTSKLLQSDRDIHNFERLVIPSPQSTFPDQGLTRLTQVQAPEVLGPELPPGHPPCCRRVPRPGGTGAEAPNLPDP